MKPDIPLCVDLDGTLIKTDILFICPMVLYWTTRAWLLANRGQLQEDPLLFALKDRKSYVIAVATGIIMILASRQRR